MKVSACKALLLASLALGLGACSVLQPKTDSQQVEARSQKRMDLIMAGKTEKAYEYMTPGYRATNGVPRFRADFAAGASRFIESNVSSSSCEEDVCTVKVAIKYNHVSSIGSKPIPIERSTEERWIRIDNQWWFVRQN